MKQTLDIDTLVNEAKTFCETESLVNHSQLFGITDGKAVGTYIQSKFQQHLSNKYEVTIGNSANGIDLPDIHINTDIKATSINQPQSLLPIYNCSAKDIWLGI